MKMILLLIPNKILMNKKCKLPMYQDYIKKKKQNKTQER